MISSATMTLDEVRDLLGCEVLVAPCSLDSIRISMACGADLMSDVLAFIKADALLLTGLTNPQSVRTADMADVKAIVYVRNKQPDADALALAQEMGLPLLRTALPLYEACGRLYSTGLPGCTHESVRTRGDNELHTGV